MRPGRAQLTTPQAVSDHPFAMLDPDMTLSGRDRATAGAAAVIEEYRGVHA